MPTSFRKTVDVILQKQKEREEKREIERKRGMRKKRRGIEAERECEIDKERERKDERKREREKVAPLLREKDGGTTVWRGVLTVAAVTRE